MVEINRYDMSYQKKEKDQSVMPSYVTGPRPRRETVFLNANNLPRKILLWKLITLREEDLNGLCPKESIAFDRE